MSKLNYISSSIDDKYIINFYSNTSNNYITTFPSSSVSQSVVTQSVTQSVLNNYSWINSTSSTLTDWAIISGTADIALLNPNRDGQSTLGYALIGSRMDIRGNEIFTNVHRESSSAKHNGIAIFKTGSTGWALNGYINIPTSSGGVSTTALGIGRDFSLYENHIAAPAYVSSGADSRLHIFKSSSSGWNLEQTLTTASYNDGAAVDVDVGYNTFLSVKIHGNRLVTSGFTRATGGSSQYERYLGIFKSGSSGWEFEDSVLIRDNGTSGGAANTGGSVGISSVAMDFDGTRIIVGSLEGIGAEYYHNDAGTIYIINSSSADGWALERKLNLQDAGITSDVTSDFGSTYGASEYRTFRFFGYMGCSISGSYIAASAEGKEINIGSSNYARQKSAVFVFKSSSSGWNLDKRLNDPITEFVATGAQNDTTYSQFGLGLKIRKNSIFTYSPYWVSNTSVNQTYGEGRAYIYLSSSSDWTLSQTINNPFSGSSIYGGSSSGKNHKFGGNSQQSLTAGEVGYGVNFGLSGSLLALGAPNFTRNAAEDIIDGAIVVLSGSANFVDQVVDEYITESVTSTTLVTRSGGAVPFRFSSKGAFNIRGQSPTGYYKTFVGDQKN
ncbi:MAG: hypothetical protein CBD16_03375 [Betaproteobacteria bacterium TMED156]|nr:MAG: hypothetical protein CBD16_03375 [Betaproteobacteria bacterium TMED156]